ncbi:auxin-responsive protein SAUR77 [Arachis duranensis]|uniref:Auxin-responsive protein SAUR77 n=1 Tax=Arachis duranensis TaxID=130453 RepID=A0A6P4D9Z2_ARADU|nr:auxin-responsive protein SAUR77 [Arachis duranensis]XP_057762294.1 auxin-responsive protein SAUR77 [Arachis stenosperma]
MDCLVMPVSLIRRRSVNSRMGYRPVGDDGLLDDHERPVTVVVGKERRVFMVEPFILRENPFRVLMEISMKKAEKDHFHFTSNERRVIFVDVDSILFEHMLWLMQNDASSLFQLNLKEIIDFYSQDI